jgi:hypothetical protein
MNRELSDEEIEALARGARDALFLPGAPQNTWDVLDMSTRDIWRRRVRYALASETFEIWWGTQASSPPPTGPGEWRNLYNYIRAKAKAKPRIKQTTLSFEEDES